MYKLSFSINGLGVGNRGTFSLCVYSADQPHLVDLYKQGGSKTRNAHKLQEIPYKLMSLFYIFLNETDILNIAAITFHNNNSMPLVPRLVTPKIAQAL